MDRHAAVQDGGLDAFAAEYIRNRAARTPAAPAEELAEARGVHRPGVEMASVFAGEHLIM
jgi:hypothetical protein